MDRILFVRSCVVLIPMGCSICLGKVVGCSCSWYIYSVAICSTI